MGGLIGLGLGIIEGGGCLLMERELVCRVREEVRGVLDCWSSSLTKFSHVFGMPMNPGVGMDGNLKLLKRTKGRKEHEHDWVTGRKKKNGVTPT